MSRAMPCLDPPPPVSSGKLGQLQKFVTNRNSKAQRQVNERQYPQDENNEKYGP